MITLRAARERDRDVLAGHILELNRIEDPYTQDRCLDHADAEAYFDVLWARVQDTDGLFLVAEQGGAVVAHIAVTIEEQPIYVRADRRRYAYVSDLFVQKAVRRQGIASRLLEEAETLARKKGFTRLMIGIVSGNDPAKRTYERFGFTPYAIEFAKEV